MELIKDYECVIHYHPGRANLVADALSRKSSGRLACLRCSRASEYATLISLGVEFHRKGEDAFIAQIRVRPLLLDRIRELQMRDDHLMKWRKAVEDRGTTEYVISEDGTLMFGNRVCVPNDSVLKQEILEEAHQSLYAMHPGSTKMYRDLREMYWWPGMKNDIAVFVSKCLTCQQIKAEHQRPAGLLQPLPIPQWKWEHVTMDFVVGLPRTPEGYDSIWVIVDRLTKSAHFLLVKTTYALERYARLYVQEIVRLHGAPVSIVSDRDPRFTSKFWPSLQQALGTTLKFSTAFHPQTDGQSERTIQTLEDMLRACVIDFKGSWGDYLALIEFAYNNSYQGSIDMAPFEALYGRKCRTPICWTEVGEKQLLGPELVQITTEKIKVVQENLKVAQSRQKSYADNRRRELEFQVGDRVFLKVSPWKGVLRFGRKGKLAPRYIGPYLIVERVGAAAYRLELPEEMARLHNVFHVSMLRKYVVDPSHVLEREPVELADDFSYEEEPVQILDRREQTLDRKSTRLNSSH